MLDIGCGDAANLVAMAWASRAITTWSVIRNWLLVYAGNLVGAVGTAFLMLWTRTWLANDGGVGLNAVRIAAAKTDLGFVEAFSRGILCNALVCLAVWLCQSARSTTGKILAIIWHIAGFVALGFEHSIANMYFIPIGILLESQPEAAAAVADAGVAVDTIKWSCFVANLIPVTLGNIVGGTLLVAGIYWFVYLRNRDQAPGLD